MSEATPSPPSASLAPVIVVRLESIIHAVAAEHLDDGIAAATESGASLLLVELSTPGGLLDVTREMVQVILGSPVPVVTYVAPAGARAASAGFFLLLAGDVAVMAPGTNTGAAHPVGGQGEDIEGAVGEKVLEDTAAIIRAIATERGRDVELAESAVKESRSFTAREALDAGLVDLVAPSREELLRLLDGREIIRQGETVALRTLGAPVEEVEIDAFRKLLAALAHPQVAYLLMALGWLGLYTELSNPGGIVPGVVGAICLVLGFYGLSVLPVSYAGIALIFLALVFFFAETQAPSFGILTLAGVISLLVGSMMLWREANPVLRIGGEVIATVTVLTLLLGGLLMWKSLQIRRIPVHGGAEGMVRERGVARSELLLSGGPGRSADAPFRGKVFVHGEVWSASSKVPVPAGADIEVVAVEGLRLRVQPVGGTAEDAAASQSAPEELPST